MTKGDFVLGDVGIALLGWAPGGDLLKGIGKVGRKLNAAVPALNKVSKLDGIPATGIAKYDKLAVESKHFDKFIKGVESRGFKINRDPKLPQRTNLRMERNKMIFDYNPKTFNVLDMRHEIQHFNQYKKLGKSTYDDIPAMERGAYGFELRLGTRAGFNSEYMDWAASRLRYFGGQWP